MSEVSKIYRVTIGDTTTELTEEAMIELQKQINDAIGKPLKPPTPNQLIPRDWNPTPTPFPSPEYHRQSPEIWGGTTRAAEVGDTPNQIQPDRTH